MLLVKGVLSSGSVDVCKAERLRGYEVEALKIPARLLWGPAISLSAVTRSRFL